MKNSKKKYIPTPQNPQTARKTAIYLGPANIENYYISWRFSKADIGGPYACNDFSHNDFQQLWERLRAFENMNTEQLRDNGSFHPKPVDELTREQKERLQQIELDDIDEIYSFRITGKCRMWCIKYGSILLLLWWDRDHDIAPSVKKHS